MLKELLIDSYKRYPSRLLSHGLRPLYAGKPLMKERDQFIWLQGDHFYILIDCTDGMVADMRFTAKGPLPLIAIADAACELLMRKHYRKIKSVKLKELIHLVADEKEALLCPDLMESALFVLNELESTFCKAPLDLPDQLDYVERETPVFAEGGSDTPAYPHWPEIPDEEKMRILTAIIEKEIQPYVALDEGSVHVMELRHGIEVIIGYAGSCTTCYSSTGSTLNAISQILKAKVYPHLIVVADPSLFNPPQSSH